MSFMVENLRVWQFAMDFGDKTHELSKVFPKEETTSVMNGLKNFITNPLNY
jgi:hypothetical protein